MPYPVNPFKSWCAAGMPKPAPIGTWLMACSPTTAELLGHVGFDWCVVDMEHTPIDYTQMVEILRAVAITPMVPITRIPWNDTVLVKRALDAGAQTLMFPFVQTSEEAKAAVAATRYPPDGVRGVAAINRGNRYSTAGGHPSEANEQIGVIVQLETPEAIARMDEIAAVPGVDALFVGPGDLAASMGLIGQIGHADVQAALKAAAEKAGALGKPIGIVGGTTDMVQGFISYGFTYVAIQSDVAMLLNKAKEHLAVFKPATGDKPTSTAAY